MKKTTFGVIVGNRGFFPDILAKEGRKDILDVLKKNGFNAVALPIDTTIYGAVESNMAAERELMGNRNSNSGKAMSKNRRVFKTEIRTLIGCLLLYYESEKNTRNEAKGKKGKEKIK